MTVDGQVRRGSVEERRDGVFVNLAFSRDHFAATVTAFRPQDGGYAVEAKKAGDFYLRPPAWAEPSAVTLQRGDDRATVEWGGPVGAYVCCRNVRPQERLTLRWSVPVFQQTFVPQSIPDRDAPVTVDWIGNQVRSVSPRGKYLPMFEEGLQ